MTIDGHSIAAPVSSRRNRVPGRIGAAEHEAFLRAFNASDDQIRTAFAHLDLSRQGAITREQFADLVDQFFRSDDPDVPGTWLFGEPG